MVGVHVAHDCMVGSNVIMANNATLGGHVTVDDFTILGGLVGASIFGTDPCFGAAVWLRKMSFLWHGER